MIPHAVDQILADEEVDSLLTPGDILWPLTDHLNTVRDLASYDAQTDTTTIVNHRTYDAFGNITSETAPAVDHLFAFTGRPFDESTALQNNLHRWYDASVGRWLSEDPIGFAARDENLLRYVGNRPIGAVDPSGLVDRSEYRFEGRRGWGNPAIFDNGWGHPVIPFCTGASGEFPDVILRPKAKFSSKVWVWGGGWKAGVCNNFTYNGPDLFGSKAGAIYLYIIKQEPGTYDVHFTWRISVRTNAPNGGADARIWVLAGETPGSGFKMIPESWATTSVRGRLPNTAGLTGGARPIRKRGEAKVRLTFSEGVREILAVKYVPEVSQPPGTPYAAQSIAEGTIKVTSIEEVFPPIWDPEALPYGNPFDNPFVDNPFFDPMVDLDCYPWHSPRN